MKRNKYEDDSVPHFKGYLRKDGRVGIRNHAIVVTVEPALADIVNRIEFAVKGIKKIIPSFSSSNESNVMEYQLELMKKLCLHPNIGAVLWVGTPEICEKVQRDEVAASFFSFCRVETSAGGSLFLNETVMKGMLDAAELVQKTSQEQRKNLPINLLKIALECGGSDYSSGIVANPTVGQFVDQWIGWGGAAVFSETAEIIGAEDILIKRSINESVGHELRNLVQNFEQRLTRKGINVKQSNPSWENKNGGITTIEEKALGAVSKGGTTPLQKVLQYGETVGAYGLHFMDTPSFSPESLTGMALGGCQLCLFTTGVGNPYSDMIMPTLKITARKSTGKNLKNHIDIDISHINEGETAVGKINKQVMVTISGQLTKAEIWGDEGVLLPWMET